MRVMILAAFAALAACAPTATPEPGPAPAPQKQEQAMSDAVPAPTPAGVEIRLTAADKGRTVTAAVGQRIAVELVGVPTAGYLWGVADKPAFLGDPVERSGNTSRAQSQPGFAGGNHWEVFVFEAKAAGEGRLRLEQRRPWEPKTEPATDTFEVTVRVQ